MPRLKDDLVNQVLDLLDPLGKRLEAVKGSNAPARTKAHCEKLALRIGRSMDALNQRLVGFCDATDQALSYDEPPSTPRSPSSRPGARVLTFRPPAKKKGRR